MAIYKFDIKIYGIHERDFIINELKKSLILKDEDICYDDRKERGSCLYTLGKACTSPIPKDVTHRLAMPDDMIVCNNFKFIINKIIKTHPNEIIALWPYRFNRFYEESKKLKTPYVKSLGGIAGNGIIFPVKYIEHMWNWIKNEHTKDYNTFRSETAMVDYIRIHQLPVIYTIPSPVQHVGDDYGTYLHYEVNRNRKTLYFRQDCLTGVDWDNKEVAIFPHIKYFERTHAEYFKLPKCGLLEEDKCFNPRNYINLSEGEKK